MKKLLDVPATTDVFTKDLQEQRAIYRIVLDAQLAAL